MRQAVLLGISTVRAWYNLLFLLFFSLNMEQAILEIEKLVTSNVLQISYYRVRLFCRRSLKWQCCLQQTLMGMCPSWDDFCFTLTSKNSFPPPSPTPERALPVLPGPWKWFPIRRAGELWQYAPPIWAGHAARASWADTNPVAEPFRVLFSYTQQGQGLLLQVRGKGLCLRLCRRRG